MSTFTMPFSSSPPSTPDTRSRNGGYANHFANMATNTTTTPAGPPPSSANSFTPVGPPPSSMFGSSQLQSNHKSFPAKPNFGLNMGSQRNPNSPSFKTVHPNRHNLMRDGNSAGSSNLRQGFQVPGSSSPLEAPSDISEFEEDSQVDGEVETDEGDEQDDDDMDMDEQEDASVGDEENITPSRFGSSFRWETYSKYGSPLKDSIPRGTKRSRAGGAVAQSFGSSFAGEVEPPKKKDSAIPGILRGLAAGGEVLDVTESDELILATEDVISRLYSSDKEDVASQTALSTASEDLTRIWQSSVDNDARHLGTDEYVIGIGPNGNAPSISKASFLSTFLLQLHHPPPLKGKQAFAFSRSGRASGYSESTSNSQVSLRPSPPPKVLLDWLNAHHNPYPTATIDLQTYQPNPTAHLNFWDIIFSAMLRGRIADVIRILKETDFRHGRTAVDDGQGQDGYRGVQLGNITRVINRAIMVLEICPAMKDDNWDVKGTDWIIFRRRVEQAAADLATFAEGRDREAEDDNQHFRAENFGIQGSLASLSSLSRSTRMAESKVPWTIYQNLKAIYGLLLGGTTEIISFAQDWVEATIGLTAWWDGDDNDEITRSSLGMSRRSIRRSQSLAPRSVDVDVLTAYLRRLSYAFDRVTDGTDEEAFQINSLNPVEVGLASIFEGNVEGVIGLLRGWSLPITSAVVEIASLGGWLGIPSGTKMMNNFNESDLMVLSYGQDKQRLGKDEILVEYADALSDRDLLRSEQYDIEREGWELSVEILGRLDDDVLSSTKICQLLDELPLDSGERVDNLLNICSELGLDIQTRKIAERYADSLAKNTNEYGTALLYYARAHQEKKIKDVLDLLISLCLVQSVAYPAASDLDDDLALLVTSPKEVLTALSAIDADAAEMLKLYLSGYATLRRFYDLRDTEINLAPGQKPSLRPLARKREAATALVSVINSAADSIHGGLYDPDRHAIVQVDGLLTLLAESLPLLNHQPKRLLTLPQSYALLKAIEDLQTVSARVYDQCEECFRSTLANARGERVLSPEAPRALLKKSLSGLTGSSGFSMFEMVGSEVLAPPSREQEMDVDMQGEEGERRGRSRSIGSSGVLVKGKDERERERERERAAEVKRGWDWRTGLKADVKGEDVLGILRLGLAREVARGWLDGDGDR